MVVVGLSCRVRGLEMVLQCRVEMKWEDGKVLQDKVSIQTYIKRENNTRRIHST